jgi:hypothetical protein
MWVRAVLPEDPEDPKDPEDPEDIDSLSNSRKNFPDGNESVIFQD